MKERAIELLNSQGVDASIKLLRAGEWSLAPDEQIQAFDQVRRHAYWKKKDLPGAIQIGQAGIALGEQLAAKFPEKADKIMSQVKGIHYNLASFTWPGWDEPDIKITPEQVQLGLAAARENFRLAIELKKDALPLSRACWMLGAQEMAVKDYSSAIDHFYQAEQFAEQAVSREGPQQGSGEALLARGFAQLVSLLAKPGGPKISSDLDKTKIELASLESGEFFIKQIDDAWRVFRD